MTILKPSIPVFLETYRTMKRPSLIALAVLLLLAGSALVFLQHMRRGTDVSVKTETGTIRNSHVPRESNPARPSRMPAFIAKLRDSSLKVRACLEAVRGLPDDLTDREFEQLLDLIKGPVPESGAPMTGM